MLSKIALLFSALSLAAAQQNYPVQSAPFNLVLSSSTNSSLNGIKLAACHTGASVESLCLFDGGRDSTYTFYFNTTTDTPDPTTLQTGLVTWTLEPSTINFNEALSFQYNTASNLAFPLIWPSLDTVQEFAFTDEEHLAVPAYVNDAIEPPTTYRGGVTFWDNRWQICQTYWQAYAYTALQWTLGGGAPQNPSCDAVTVSRVFI
ncbi:hypothetical protein BKA67DRAFT_573601 [Truncatella angustata]|uniref:DUF7907 domain-containing protein n=1 Tax=Truncatella angustata TaxID=152316 RepID=A0A9P8ZV69_9PEZI|nr:uncharacterized protein BKA67DRAFT_573601 [Truncatella angustata]KAH6652334.1 hypothetical protein BKA67DRAFT_573601 [Truncatella angustata]KAH8205132.1 hypothetical protein TruAng_000697 [Truncatella angustata]